MLALDRLGIAFSDAMPVGRQVALVSAPVVRQEALNTERLQQRFQLQKCRIRSIAEHISENDARRMIDRMPQPALTTLAADEAPHLVDLANDYFYNDFIATLPSEKFFVHELEGRLFFLTP